MVRIEKVLVAVAGDHARSLGIYMCSKFNALPAGHEARALSLGELDFKASEVGLCEIDQSNYHALTN